jgi:hypothetical protein
MALTDNLVHYWKMDEASGNIADSVGSNTGTATSLLYGATYGKINGGSGFDGALSKIALTTFAFDGTNKTISLWCNIASDCVDRGTLVYSQNSATTPYWEIGVAVSSAERRIYYSDHVSGRITYTTDIKSAWHHVAVTKSGATITVYVDGVSRASGSGISGNDNAGITVSKIGANYADGSKYKGNMDEVGVWSRALSGAEIASLYNSGSGSQYPFSTSNIKVFNGLAYASVKLLDGLAIASVKSKNNLA